MSLAAMGDPAGCRSTSALYPPPSTLLKIGAPNFLEGALYTNRQCSLPLLVIDVASTGETCNTYSKFFHPPPTLFASSGLPVSNSFSISSCIRNIDYFPSVEVCDLLFYPDVPYFLISIIAPYVLLDWDHFSIGIL